VKLYYNDYNIDNDWSAAPPVPSQGSFHHMPQYATRQEPNNFSYCRSRSDQDRNRPTSQKIEGAKCLIDMVREAGSKIDGIGLQGHYVYNTTPSASRLADIMQGFADMDLDIAITELDIRMDFFNINEYTISQQAQGYADVLTACRFNERCVGVTIWDFSDRYSWVTSVIEGFGSALPWDTSMVLKEKIWVAIMRGWGGEGNAGC
jgi:endo-1,4-beta-xylanase